MTAFPYTLDGPIAPKALGLIVLQTDETIEHDFRRLFGPGLALYVNRISSGAEVTEQSLGAMEERLPAAARLLPPAAALDVVGYACTSASSQIGAARVAELITGACSAAHVTDPMTAALRAMKALGAGRIGLVSPYIPPVAANIARSFTSGGFQIGSTLSFGEQVEERVARIDAASLMAAARRVAEEGPVDAIFLSCTNLRTLDVIPQMEAELNCPIVSSNQAIAWDMARLAGHDVPSGPGRLFQMNGQP